MTNQAKESATSCYLNSSAKYLPVLYGLGHMGHRDVLRPARSAIVRATFSGGGACRVPTRPESAAAVSVEKCGGIVQRGHLVQLLAAVPGWLALEYARARAPVSHAARTALPFPAGGHSAGRRQALRHPTCRSMRSSSGPTACPGSAPPIDAQRQARCPDPAKPQGRFMAAMSRKRAGTRRRRAIW